MKVYFDTCCYCRSQDDQKQERIRLETRAIMTAIEECRIAGHSIVGSDALTFELGDIRDPGKREHVEAFFVDTIDSHIAITEETICKAQLFIEIGMDAMDSVHLAATDSAGIDYLITTDDNFIKIAAGLSTMTKVINPITFLREVMR